jgi:hypothetical protein
MARRKNENGGWEESSARNQRLRVRESGMRSGSFTGGAAASKEQPSTKRRRNAALRAIKL